MRPWNTNTVIWIGSLAGYRCGNAVSYLRHRTEGPQSYKTDRGVGLAFYVRIGRTRESASDDLRPGWTLTPKDWELLSAFVKNSRCLHFVPDVRVEPGYPETDSPAVDNRTPF